MLSVRSLQTGLRFASTKQNKGRVPQKTLNELSKLQFGPMILSKPLERKSGLAYNEAVSALPSTDQSEHYWMSTMKTTVEPTIKTTVEPTIKTTMEKTMKTTLKPIVKKTLEPTRNLGISTKPKSSIKPTVPIEPVVSGAPVGPVLSGAPVTHTTYS